MELPRRPVPLEVHRLVNVKLIFMSTISHKAGLFQMSLAHDFERRNMHNEPRPLALLNW